MINKTIYELESNCTRKNIDITQFKSLAEELIETWESISKRVSQIDAKM